MQEAFDQLKRDLATCASLEEGLRGKRNRKVAEEAQAGVAELVRAVVQRTRQVRARVRDDIPEDDLSDAGLSQYARFTSEIALAPFEKYIHYVPRVVNVVTLAEAVPVEGYGLSLPLDLRYIARRCKSCYYAPRRFAAIQLAFSNPRCRVLVFHTGRLVGTGCDGHHAARLAISRAQRQLAQEAGVHLHIRSFCVINTVAATSLRATLNCDAFASAHSSESHFDRSSFVGLAWRPKGESCSCEIYSTGRANLPGALTLRDLLHSYSRMLPELLRFSSRSYILPSIPEALQAVHRLKPGVNRCLEPPHTNLDASAPRHSIPKGATLASILREKCC
jgi:TATA-box binding protein (TBP) (component of TFIID and TFIIIB)